MTTLVQTVAAASAAANPANITVSPASTQVGTFLYLVVIAIGASTPGITTPAGFTLQFTTQSGTMKTAVFTQSNNPGSITSVVTTLTNSPTGAVAFLVEITGNPLSRLTFINAIGGSGTGSGYGSIQAAPQESMYLERWFATMCHNTAQAQSTTPGAAYTQIGGTQISTVGSPAIEGRLYTCEMSSLTWGNPAGIIAGATDNTSSLTKIAGDNSATAGVGAYGANNVGGYSGAGGAGPG